MERVMATLSGALDPARFEVWLVSCLPGGALAESLLPHVHHVALGHPRKFVWWPRLWALVQKVRPFAVLATGGNFENFVWLRRLSPSRFRLVVRPAAPPAFYTPAYLAQQGRALARVSGVIGQGNNHARAWAAVAPAAQNHFFSIVNPVDAARVRKLATQPADPLPGQTPRLLCPASLQRNKGQEMVIEAMGLMQQRGHAPPTFICLGREYTPGYQTYLQNLATERGVADHVFFLPQAPNPWPLMAQADGIVLASHLEGFPNVLVEAMALGKPVLATDCPTGPGDIVTPETGLLVTPESVCALADGLVDFLSRLPAFDPAVIQKSAQRFDLLRVLPLYEKALFQQD